MTAIGCLKTVAAISTSLVGGVSPKFCNWGDGNATEYINNRTPKGPLFLGH